MTKNPPKQIVVAMSGGVDSSVSAWILKEQGYAVQGLFMKNWEEDDTESYCSAAEDLKDVEAVCRHLDIPLHSVNFSAEYWEQVFEYFLASYRQGYTPNPDILCNREIKFKVFWEHAKSLGAACMATGHYCQQKYVGEEYFLCKAQDSNKDQSYFLYTLTQAQLARSLFPIGHLTKPDVRQLAQKIGLPNHAKKDSVGICFIGERKFKKFLERYIPNEPGSIENLEGEMVGQHTGLMYYTIGQREGLGIGGRKNTSAEPWYVLDKDLSRKVLLVGQGHQHPYLLTRRLVCHEVHWISPCSPKFPFRCSAKTRYRQTEQPCEIIPISANEYEVVFDVSQWAVTPGQSVVFYQQDHCLGGGIIQQVIR
jgi:tRNA-uridine 2-sulfurtransferase